MSGAMENRAAVFTSSPQNVEVYRDGAWWAGALLGWRHDSSGGCQVWVRVTVRGVEETSWLALDLLRLPEAPQPERRLSAVGTAASARSADDAALTGTMAAIRAVPSPRTRARTQRPESDELTATTSLVAVRDLPEDDATAIPRRAGGRRRAPESVTAAQRALAPEPTTSPAGRHRAPASVAAAVGRHRAADTGVLTAVRDDDPVPLPELPRRRPSGPSLDQPDSHLLTRPMRLGDALDGIPQPRRGRDGRLSGV